MPEMSPAAMDTLSATVRALRTVLQDDLSQQLERRFRLSVPVSQAGLDAKSAALREGLEAWLKERARSRAKSLGIRESEAREQVRKATEIDFASRLLLRLVLLRQLESAGLSRPVVLTNGWNSKGYLELRSHAPALAEGDYEGFDVLLKLLFDELAVDLPGLYGESPLDRFFTISPAVLRMTIERLDAPELASAWDDDTTLGWVYQFWNDPHREAIDERIGPRGKIRADELAAKTQLFTEQYMVEWLVQNSLGRIVLEMRNQWRASAGEDAYTATWPYFVAGGANADSQGVPKRLSDLKILDPACGSGHFLAGAFDFLVPLYREEARFLGIERTDQEIAATIIEKNLHGIDIDGRAVQVAAAMLYLKARRLARPVRLPRMNLVATSFDLDGLDAEDPAFAALAKALGGSSVDLQRLSRRFRDVSWAGSLTRFSTSPLPVKGATLSLFDESRSIAEIERFIETHTRKDDLGVRFDGAQLASGLRLRKMLEDGAYDVVLFNPPYLATSKFDIEPRALQRALNGMTDIFAAFVDRALELCKPRGYIAFVALSNWMYLSSFRDVREQLLEGSIVLIADIGKGAFRRASKLIQTAMVVATPTGEVAGNSLAARLGSRDGISAEQVTELAASLRDSASYSVFDPSVFSQIEGAPLLFWLDSAFLKRYAEVPKIGDSADGAGGIATTDNERFLRAVWEVPVASAKAAAAHAPDASYLPYVKGADGRDFIEPYRWLLQARHGALELRCLVPSLRLDIPNRLGVAYTTIGNRFGARVHSVPSVRDISGASFFPRGGISLDALVCAMNRSHVRELASALNPTINFQLGDVRRLPFDEVCGGEEIMRRVREQFALSEQGNELSLDYRKPTSSAHSWTESWAQRAMDRGAGEPLPAYDPEDDAPAPEAHISFAIGVALGRFDANGQGVLDKAPEDALPAGILFVSAEGGDSLDHSACLPLVEAWKKHGEIVGGRDDLRGFLRKSFFAYHRKIYENRPIYFPLSSSKKSFVAYVAIHRFGNDTLNLLLADYLLPTRRRLEGELDDLRVARATGANKSRAERRFAEVQRLLEELSDFIERVMEIAEAGPPPADERTPRREVDARFVMDLDDGVMVNSAALWPLLEPQWKEPKKWWKEVAMAAGRKDYDWSRLAARYFPTRVREKCMENASLAVAHGKFWELHPATAYAWELRVQEELRADFVLEEAGAEALRARFLAENGREAREIEAAERKRRGRKGARGGPQALLRVRVE